MTLTLARNALRTGLGLSASLALSLSLAGCSPSAPDQSEPERVYQAVKQVAAAGPLEDDFSMMSLTFP